MATEIIDNDGVVTEFAPMGNGNQSIAVALSRAEIDQQISTALAYPRDERKGGIRRIIKLVTEAATINQKTAESCIYALPRGGKPIKGPSIRLAEIIVSKYGNCRVGARVVHVDRFEKYVEAEGIFHDLETNALTTKRVRRRLVDKQGRLFSDDMIIVTGNAACSIALRNAVLAGVPSYYYEEAYEAAAQAIAGDIKTLAERREASLKAFFAFGVKPEQVFAALEVHGADDIGLDEIATLTAMFRAIKAEEHTVEDFFPAITDQSKAADAAKGTAAKIGSITGKGKDKAKADEGAAGKGGEAAGNQPETGAQGRVKGKADTKPKETAKPASDDAQQQTHDSDGNDGEAAATKKVEERQQRDAYQPSDDELEAAYNRGAAAKADGMSRRTLPPEWREEPMAALAEAWERGFDGE